MKKIIIVLFSFILMSCGGDIVHLTPQAFDGNVYQIEVRPGPRILKGYNEFILIISDKNRQPVPDFIIDLRVNDKADWKQMIQDGKIGVYRRAVSVSDPQTEVLKVRVRKGKGVLTTLKFSLVPSK